MSLCPIECTGVGCPQPDFIERNGAFVLTVIGVITGFLGGLFTFFLKSRCKRIKLCCLECDRTPITLDVTDVEVNAGNSNQ